MKFTGNEKDERPPATPLLEKSLPGERQEIRSRRLIRHAVGHTMGFHRIDRLRSPQCVVHERELTGIELDTQTARPNEILCLPKLGTLSREVRMQLVDRL